MAWWGGSTATSAKAPSRRNWPHALEHSQPIIIVTIQTFPVCAQGDREQRQPERAPLCDHRRRGAFVPIRLDRAAAQRGADGRRTPATMRNSPRKISSMPPSPPAATAATSATSPLPPRPRPKTLELFGRLPNPAAARHRSRTSPRPFTSTPCARRSRKALSSMC